MKKYLYNDLLFKKVIYLIVTMFFFFGAVGSVAGGGSIACSANVLSCGRVGCVGTGDVTYSSCTCDDPYWATCAMPGSDYCRDSTGALQSCGGQASCVCLYNSPSGGGVCSDINDACYGDASCCGGSGSTCGNGICDSSETTTTCPSDCPANTGPVDGVCGTLNNQPNTGVYTPVSVLCAQGTPSSLSGYGPVYWTCLGINGGTDSSQCHTTFSGLPVPPALTLCETNMCTSDYYPGYYYYPAVDKMVSSYCLPSFDDCNNPAYQFNDGSRYWYRRDGKDTTICLNLQTPVPTCSVPTTDLTVNYYAGTSGVSINNIHGTVVANVISPITLNWTVSGGAISCNINGTSVSTTGGSDSSKIAPTSAVGSVTYTLNCSNAAGNATPVSVTITVPPSPTNPTESCPSPGTTATESWTAPVGGYTHFYVRTNTPDGAGAQVPAGWNDDFVGTTYTFPSTAGTQYGWWVHTRAANGAYSNSAGTRLFTCQTLAIPPSPTGLSVTPSTCGNNWLNISWNASSGATSYQVYKDGNGTPIYDGALLSFSDTGLVLGSNHSYTVRATNGSGSSALSSSVSNTVASICSVPTISSPTVSAITQTSATLGANVTSSGSSGLTARGTCWGITATPVTNCQAQGGLTTGIFTQNRTGMTSGTTYYFRGYATNSSGTGYSIDGTFNTASVLPTISSFTATPSSGLSGFNTTLNWTVTGATSCTASGGTASWTSSPSKNPAGGSQVISGITSDTSFTLTCVNAVGDSTQSTVNTVVTSSQYSIRVTPTIGGYITSNPSGIDCGADCSNLYDNGTVISLIPHPDSASWKFVGWTGACTGSGIGADNHCDVVANSVNDSKFTTAIFVPRPTYTEF